MFTSGIGRLEENWGFGALSHSYKRLLEAAI